MPPEKTRPEWSPSPQSKGGPHFAVYLVLCGERPSLGGMGFDLAGVRTVTMGRGGPLGLGARGTGEARIDVPDPTMSGEHARLVVGEGEVTIEDLGSRNGTRVLGRPVRQAKLTDGGCFVLGRSAFVVRELAVDVDVAPLGPGGSPAMVSFVPRIAKLYQTAAELAPSRVPLLLIGETGTGKDVLATEIHRMSGRRGRFVPVNCAALPETLVESELFGYRKGAFSEAREDRVGLIRSAADGTLLLDEIGDLPLPGQAKLLRVLQDGEVLALGSSTAVRVDVRVLAATQRSLDDLVREGRFRADLLGRLAGFVLSVPPLRERVEDLGLLVSALLARHAGAEATSYRFTADACAALLERRWSLNVRELERVLQAAVELARPTREIGVEHLGAEPRLTAARELGRDELQSELVRLMHLRGGNISAVARDMGKARMQIHRWLQQFGLEPGAFRTGSEVDEEG